jgi:hypothetical protein
VAVARDPAPSFLGDVGAPPLAILAAALVLMTLAVISLRASRRELEKAATSDGLTGLANRRQLMADLERHVARPMDRAVLLLFDLDGFKNYNDAFGHLAGDALLTRLGHSLDRCVRPHGRAPIASEATSSACWRTPAPAPRSSAWCPPRWSSTATGSRSAPRTAPSPSRKRRPSPPRHCSSPISACTRRRTPGAPWRGARAPTSCYTLIRERIVAAAPALGAVAKLVRASHERWDGNGYPDAIAGQDIPLGARIVAVCDAYDAIVADRPYRRGRGTAEAMAELRRCAGTQFDPAVVDAFAAVLAVQDATDAAAAA